MSSTSKHNPHEPVAIVGMGCRWPGGAHDTAQFWEFLKNRVNGWKEFDDPRFSSRGFHHPNSDRPGAMSMKGAFLAEQDARLFDHSFFGMTGLEVETMDPSQRKLLEVAYEAIENAGETWESVSGTRTGVFVGNFCLDHWMIQSRDWDNPRPYAFTGAGTSILANRISYIFNLHGPSLTVDTACSSSMYALHLAVNAIRAGDCDSAIVASANWIADPGVQIALDKLGALSASARCHTFDARAEGYARGEGFGAIYLKRPSLAIADLSPIRAMIRGTAINSNGRTGGITRPSANGQESVIREAYRNAGGLPFRDTSYFECHGTGTYVGDPIEVAALGRVFAPERSDDDPLLVGSVKSNVGHGEGASALASIMKVVLALEHGAIPPIYDLQTRNPNIDFEGAKVQPVTEVTPWPKDRLQRASINSFGYGGANGHCIIDHVNIVLPDYVAPGVYKRSARETTNGVDGHINGERSNTMPSHRPIIQRPKVTASPNASTRALVLLPLSAHNENSLELNIKALSQVIDKLPLSDVAYTLGARRSKYAQRSFCIVDKDKAVEGLAAKSKVSRAPLQPTNIGFIFTGQGAQWHAMGAQLFEYRVFSTAIQYLDYVLSSLPNGPDWSLEKILSGDCDTAFIQRAEISQAVCTAVQIGIVDLLASWSVRPQGVAGHSSGEMAAAYAAGRITAAEAIVAAYFRGQAVSRNQQTGAMLAVGLGHEDVAKYLSGQEDQIKVAAINSPGSVTLSGDPTAIDSVSKALAMNSVFNRKLQTGGNAYHSHHMLPIGREYVEMLAQGLQHIQQLGLASPEHRYPKALWVSSVTPSKDTAKSFDDPSAYWRANLESPVQFSEAVASLVSREDAPIHAVVEIGPHPALKSPVEQIVKAAGKAVVYTSTLKRQVDARLSMLQLAGTLFTLNAPVDLAAVNAVDQAAGHGEGLEHGRTCLELPPYQYTYSGLNYHESRASKEYRYRSVLRHDLLGSKVVGNAKLRPQWRNILRMKDVPWLGDHRLVPDAVLPGAAYIAMAVEAASRIHDEFLNPVKVKGFSLSDVSIKKSLVIPEDDYGVEVLTSLELVDTATTQSPTWATFSISSVSRETNEWTEHSTGRVKIVIEATEDEGDVEHGRIDAPSAPRAVDVKAWYKKFVDIGLGYGPVFQPLSDVRVDPASNLAVATVHLQPGIGVMKGTESRYAVHPASLDGAIQLGLVACHGGRPSEATTAFVPVQFHSLYIDSSLTSVGETCTIVACGQRRGIRSAHLDLQFLSADGKLLLNINSLRCVSFSSEAKPVDRAFSSPYTRLVWKPDIRKLSNSQARRIYPPPTENVDKAPLWGITNKVAHFVVYSMYETFGRRAVADRPQPSGEIGHFFDWIVRKGENDLSEMMEEARELAAKGALLQQIEELVAQAPDVMEVKIAKLLHDNAADILYERRSGMEVIIAEDLLTPLYKEGLLMTGIYPQLSVVLSGLAHANPNLRVLEIGGGTGGATRIAMKAFVGPNGIKAYRDYTFTDISPGFLSAAKESMADLRDMNFSVFDIEDDPMAQGYEEQAYDLIIACQVLHATSNMNKTLSNCHKLLKPGGQLVLVETTENFIVPGVVVGTFTGYWAGIPDGRVDAPFQSLQDWDSSLREAGFAGLDLVLDDFPEPHNTTSVILAKVPELEQLPVAQSTAVHVVYGGSKVPALVERICQELQQRGTNAKAITFDDVTKELSPESRVVALLDESHMLVNANEQNLAAMQHLARSTTSFVALTSCGTTKGRAAEGALIPGLLRVLQTENPSSQYMSIDINVDNFAVDDAAEAKELARCIVDGESDLFRQASRAAPVYVDGEGNGGNPSDREFAWQNGCLWVSRHVPDAGFHSQYGLETRSMKPELLPIGSPEQTGGVRAAFETPGVLNSMYFVPYTELLQALPADFIDVAVAAVGVSSRDLDHWAGRVDGDYLTSEYAGVVTAVGSRVHNIKVGDRVYGVGKGQFSNVTRVPAAFAVKLQPNDGIIRMATMPLAYTTAVYALDHVTHIRKGQSILVQSGARDIGVAAITLAKAKGAQVFATVETAEQGKFLVGELGLPATHVISVLDSKQLQRAAQETLKGRFDVIVAAAAHGELLSLFLQVLAPLGCLVNIGGADGQTRQVISQESLPYNATYASVDPFTIFDEDPLLGAELMQSVDDYYRQGVIGPVPRITTADVGQLSSALGDFGTMSGKLVVSFENPASVVRMAPLAPTVKFDPEACYVVTGGLGGLGQSLLRWMADRGARHLALLSRRPASSVPNVQKLVETLSRRDVDVQCFACDVSKQDEVASVIKAVSAVRPVKGIVHAAVSYRDLTFDKLSPERWNEGLSAKVAGTKNLHQATLSMPLDFFVMTTSALSVYGFATQGAYTAANNFQDAFARYRRRLGLPASTVSFSLIKDVTDVGSNAATVDMFERNKTLTLDEAQFLALLEPAFLNNRTVATEGTAASSGRWSGQDDDPLSVANLHTYLDPRAMAARRREEMAREGSLSSSSTAPRWYSDGRVSLMMQAFVDAQRHSDGRSQDSVEEGGSKNTIAHLRAELEAAVREGEGGRGRTVALVQEAITKAVAEMLFVDVESIDPAKSVAELGVDSLIAAELRNWFIQALGTNISMLDLLDPSVSISTRASTIADKALSVAAKT